MNSCYHIEKINKFLKGVLEFYANPDNYFKNEKIKLDGGVQANHALKTAKQLEDEYLNEENKYSDYVDKIKEDEFLKKEFLDVLKNIKKP